MKAAWELMEIFYADKHSQPWLPEWLVDWLTVMILYLLGSFHVNMHFEIFFADSVTFVDQIYISWQDYDCLLSSTQTTIHSKLMGFEKELVSLQV